jgi:hypothetical protein
MRLIELKLKSLDWGLGAQLNEELTNFYVIQREA